MNIKSRNIHGEPSSREGRSDGRFEGPINDSFPDSGRQMGVGIDADPTLPKQPANPFHATPQVDPDMERLREMMNAKEV